MMVGFESPWVWGTLVVLFVGRAFRSFGLGIMLWTMIGQRSPLKVFKCYSVIYLRRRRFLFLLIEINWVLPEEAETRRHSLFVAKVYL